MLDQKLAIASVRELSDAQFALAFDSPEIAAATRPGQFVMISAGGDTDPLLRRPMAVCRILRDADGAPTGFNMVIEVMGRGTALLQQRRAGDRLRVLGPMGNPFPVPDPGAVPRQHLLVMGGVGAAPFPLLAEELLDAGHEVRAFVGARTAELLLCLDDFEELGVPVELATDDGSRGFHGFVTGPLESYLAGVSEPPATLYACGPTPMMRAVHEIAEDRDLPLLVSLEAPMACGIGVCLSCVLRVRDADREEGWAYARCCREGPVFDSRELIWE